MVTYTDRIYFSASVTENREVAYSTITVSSAGDDIPITSIVDKGEETVPGPSGLQGTPYQQSNHDVSESLEASQPVSDEQQLDFLPNNQLGLYGGLWPIDDEEEEQYFRRIGHWVQHLPDANSGKYFTLVVK